MYVIINCTLFTRLFRFFLFRCRLCRGSLLTAHFFFYCCHILIGKHRCRTDNSYIHFTQFFHKCLQITVETLCDITYSVAFFIQYCHLRFFQGKMQIGQSVRNTFPHSPLPRKSFRDVCSYKQPPYNLQKDIYTPLFR